MAESVNRQINIFLNENDLQAAMTRLQASAEKLEKKIANAASPQAQQQLQQQLDTTRGKIDTLSQQISGKLAPSLRQMEQATRKAWDQLQHMPVGTPEWKAKLAEFDKLNSQLIKTKEQVGTVGKAMKTFAGEIKTVAVGVLVGNTLQQGVQMVAAYFTGLVSGAAKLSDDFADIAKTTGLTTAQIQQLNKAFSEIDTRTPTAELRRIAVVAGQLGISAQEDILSFVKSINQLAVALGDDFSGGAEEVADSIGRLRNVLTDIKTGDISGDLLRIGDALNYVAGKGSATAPVMVDFANRIGGVGVTLGLSSGQILGLSATLQELSVNSERGGTAVSKILQKLTQQTETFGKIAGYSTKKDLKAFADLVNTDIFAAFQQVIKGAKEGGANATALSGIIKELEISGAGASEVFAKLGNNMDLLNKRVGESTASLMSTISVTNEYNLKNENTAAKVEKLEKTFTKFKTSRTVTETVGAMIDATTRFLKILTYAPDLIAKYSTAIILLTTVAAAYVVQLYRTQIATRAAAAGQALYNGAVAIGSAIKAVYMAYEKTMIVLWELAAGRLTRAAAAQALYNATLGALAGTIALPIVAIGALVAAFDYYIKHTDAAVAAERHKQEAYKKSSEAVSEAKKGYEEINQELLKWNELSETEKQNLRDKLKLQIQNTEAKIEEIKASRKLLAAENDRAGFWETKMAAIKAVGAYLTGGKNIGDLDKSIVTAAEKAGQNSNDKAGVRDIAIDYLLQAAHANSDEAAKPQTEAIEALEEKLNDMKRTFDDVRSAEELYTGAMGTATDTVAGLTEKQNILQKAIHRAKLGSEIYLTIQKELIAVKKLLTKANATESQSEEDLAKARAKQAEEYAKLLEKLKQMQRDFEIAQMNSDDAEVARLKDKFTKLRAEAAGHYKAMLLVEKLFREEMEALQNKKFKSGREKSYTASINTTDKTYDSFQDDLKKQKLQALQNANDVGESVQAIEEDFARQSKMLEAQRSRAKAEVARSYVQDVERATDDAEKYQKDSDQKILDFQIDVAAKAVSAHNNSEEAKTEATAKGAAERTAILNEEAQAVIKEVETFANAFLDLYSVINEISAQQSEYEIQRSRNESEEKKAALQNQLDRKIVSQKSYNRKVEKIEKEQAEKERALKKEQFEKDKAFRIVQAVINTALGVTNAFATSGNIYSAIVMAALVAATGAAQIALIAEQKPSFRKGGIFDGPSHEQGGMPLYSRGRKVAELEGGEPILSRATYSNNRDVVDALLYSSTQQGGKKVDISNLISTRKFNAGGILPTIANVRHYENGGLAPDPNRSTDSIDTNTQVLLGIYEALQKPVPAILSNEQFEYEREKIYKARTRGTN